MFRKIKKLYFKIYHLFKLIGVFIMIFSFSMIVNAECEEVLNSSDTFSFNSRNGRMGITANTNTKGIEANTDYILYVENATQSFKDYFVETYNLSNSQVNNLALYMFPDLKECNIEENYCIAQKDGTNRGLFNMTGVGNNATLFTEHIEDYHFVKGGIECLPHDDPTNNGIFQNYVTLYGDRITYLTEGFNTNESFKYFIGIIIAFIVLEITLKLINIRRGKK